MQRRAISGIPGERPDVGHSSSSRGASRVLRRAKSRSVVAVVGVAVATVCLLALYSCALRCSVPARVCGYVWLCVLLPALALTASVVCVSNSRHRRAQRFAAHTSCTIRNSCCAIIGHGSVHRPRLTQGTVFPLVCILASNASPSHAILPSCLPFTTA